MTDEEFKRAEDVYFVHMARFIQAHRAVPNGDLLIEMERQERWTRNMGAGATLLEAPARELIEARAPETPQKPADQA